MKTKFLILMTASIISLCVQADGSRPVRVDFEFTNESDKTVSSINLGKATIVCDVALVNCKGRVIAMASESGIDLLIEAQDGFKGKFRYSIEGTSVKTRKIENSVETKLIY